MVARRQNMHSCSKATSRFKTFHTRADIPMDVHVLLLVGSGPSLSVHKVVGPELLLRLTVLIGSFSRRSYRPYQASCCVGPVDRMTSKYRSRSSTVGACPEDINHSRRGFETRHSVSTVVYSNNHGNIDRERESVGAHLSDPWHL